MCVALLRLRNTDVDVVSHCSHKSKTEKTLIHAASINLFKSQIFRATIVPFYFGSNVQFALNVELQKVPYKHILKNPF